MPRADSCGWGGRRSRATPSPVPSAGAARRPHPRSWAQMQRLSPGAPSPGSGHYLGINRVLQACPAATQDTPLRAGGCALRTRDRRRKRLLAGRAPSRGLEKFWERGREAGRRQVPPLSRSRRAPGPGAQRVLQTGVPWPGSELGWALRQGRGALQAAHSAPAAQTTTPPPGQAWKLGEKAEGFQHRAALLPLQVVFKVTTQGSRGKERAPATQGHVPGGQTPLVPHREGGSVAHTCILNVSSVPGSGELAPFSACPGLRPSPSSPAPTRPPPACQWD